MNPTKLTKRTTMTRGKANTVLGIFVTTLSRTAK